MYEQCFQLNSRPFTSTPFVKHYFAAGSIQASLDSARLCIEHGSGPVVVVGETGTGKSLFLAMLEDQYRSQFSVVNLACARLDDRHELLQNILFELKLEYRGMTEGELRLSLMDFLKPSEASPNGILLLVDEAHMLPIVLLDEIRLITNCVREGQPRVRLVMAGNQRLEDNLADPKLDSFSQRIASRCYLTRLSQQETAEYVTTHINRSGGNGEQMFPESALRAIHEVTDGCPRYINQVCDHAMIMGSTKGDTIINESLIREAWHDVQSLPGEIVTKDNAQQTSSLTDNENWTVIEFGSLDDEDQSEFESDNEAAVSENDSIDAEQSDEGSKEELGLSTEPEPVESVGAVESANTDEDAASLQHSCETGGCGSGACESDGCVNDAVCETERSDSELADANVEESMPTTFVSLAPATSDSNHADSNVANASDANASVVESSDSFDNPFDESFDNEEEIVDQYAQLVAQQNQSSLNVTTQDLGLITPLEEEALGADLDQSSSSLTSVEPTDEPQFDQPQSAASIGESVKPDAVPLPEYVDREYDGGQPHSEIDIESDAEELVSEASEEVVTETTDPDPTTEDAHTAEYYMQSNHPGEATGESVGDEGAVDTERAADEILKSLTTNDETVSHETTASEEIGDAEDSSSTSTIEFTQTQSDISDDAAASSALVESLPESVGEISSDAKTAEGSVEEVDEEVPELETSMQRSQRLLENIIRQNRQLADDTLDETDENEDSNSQSQQVVAMDALQEKPKDDRDMIIVSRKDEEDVPRKNPEKEDSIPFPSTAVSTGQAKRMDYQALFDQLRTDSTD